MVFSFLVECSRYFCVRKCVCWWPEVYTGVLRCNTDVNLYKGVLSPKLSGSATGVLSLCVCHSVDRQTDISGCAQDMMHACCQVCLSMSLVYTGVLRTSEHLYTLMCEY